MEKLTLNKNQFRLLFDAKFQMLLANLTEPRTPRELSTTLAKPVGTIHYQLNRLVGEGLVFKVSDVGKTAVFQIRAAEYLISPEILPDLRDISFSRAKAQLRKLQENFLAAIDLHYDQLQEKGEVTTVSFSAQPVIKPFTPQLRSWDLSLDESAFKEILDNIELPKLSREANKVPCQLSLLLLPLPKP